MARDAYLNNGTVRDIIDRADDVLGYQLSGVMFEGPEDELRQTRNAQPAIFLHGYALYQLLDDPRPAMAAGHSLGEYTALTIANALSFDDALRLVQIRAESMQDAGSVAPGTMAAIIALDDDMVKKICAETTNELGETVVPANFNAPGQVVVSGSHAGVAEAINRAREAGARMAKELKVSGAFHSPLMASAGERLADALQSVSFVDAEFPVYVNTSGEPLTAADAIREALLKQLTSPVLWTETIRRMESDGATEFIEVGPGNVLRGMIKRIISGPQLVGVETVEQVEQFNAGEA